MRLSLNTSTVQEPRYTLFCGCTPDVCCACWGQLYVAPNVKFACDALASGCSHRMYHGRAAKSDIKKNSTNDHTLFVVFHPRRWFLASPFNATAVRTATGWESSSSGTPYKGRSHELTPASEAFKLNTNAFNSGKMSAAPWLWWLLVQALVQPCLTRVGPQGAGTWWRGYERRRVLPRL